MNYGFEMKEDNVILPLPPADAGAWMEMEIYARFMRHLRHVPCSSPEIKVLSAIQFTADILDHSDALVAKILVDLGLRAPQRAFPAAYLEHVGRSMRRDGWEAGAATNAVRLLCNYWSGEKAVISQAI